MFRRFIDLSPVTSNSHRLFSRPVVVVGDAKQQNGPERLMKKQ